MSDIVWTPVRVKLGQIVAWEKNPRQSTKAQAQRLIRSERELGQIQTFAVGPWREDRTCELYDGHQRLSAWLTVKGPDFEVVALQASRHLSEDERRKVAIMLHTATGSWDWDALGSWSAAELNEWYLDRDTLKQWNADASNLKELLRSEQAGGADAEPQVDRAEELLAKWGVQPGDLWQIGEHRLICGDCTDAATVARLMDGEMADCMWTDPPYGVQYVGKTKDALTIENDGADDLPGLLTVAFTTAQTVLIEGAPFYVAHPAGELQGVFLDVVRDIGWKIHQQLVWVKDSMVLGHSDYHYMHEPVLYGWTPGKGRPGRGNHEGSHWYGDNAQTSVFMVDRPKRSAEHPTMKPPELVEAMLKNSTKADGIVYEPFSGSGTTLVACENLGRKCRAIEISPAYVAVALERMATAFPHLEIRRVE